MNDLGSAWTGEGSDRRPAEDVVAEIEAAGGSAVANFDDVTEAAAAERLVQQAVDTFGDLDILVNNAGILRDGMVFSIDPQEWQSVVNVHLMGHFLPTRAATAYWRERAKSGDAVPHRTIVNTSSESGLFGNAAQSNYDAAKLGIASFTIAVAKETAKYNVTCNAIAPRACTRAPPPRRSTARRVRASSGRSPPKSSTPWTRRTSRRSWRTSRPTTRATSRARRSSCTAASWDGCECPTSTRTS